MPSFDVVSEVDKHTLTNAVDQARRLIKNRFDFKGVDASYEKNDFLITMVAEVDFQLTQMLDILQSALLKNLISIECLEIKDVVARGKQVKQEVMVRTGLESDLCKKIVKMLKAEKFKAQSQIQGDQVRVAGKKRDDLQTVIAFLRKTDIDMPLQFTNFRD